MTKRIFNAVTAVSLGMLCIVFSAFIFIIYNVLSSVVEEQMMHATEIYADGCERYGYGFIKNLSDAEYRVTLVSPSGEVLFDSAAVPQSGNDVPENNGGYLEREEIKNALLYGTGTSSRYSSTVSGRLIYTAKKLSDGSVLRLSRTALILDTLRLDTITPFYIVSACVALLCLALAVIVSRTIVKPIDVLASSSGAPQPAKDAAYDELSPLLKQLDDQHGKINTQAKELKKKRKEFEAVWEYIQEGLILLDSHMAVLSINDYAAASLGIDKDECSGKAVSELSPELYSLVTLAFAKKHTEGIVSSGGKMYRADVSAVSSDVVVTGFVILMSDVTEKEDAERMRREFTANVSHELKTPLHSISGCAEMLAGGMVKNEDIPTFSTQIYQEAKRLIQLVDDIIKLSRLDEAGETISNSFTAVDLFDEAVWVADSLADKAEKNNVSLSVTGKSCMILGTRQTADAIIYNLCDNGIKYNKRGGRVEINISEKENGVTLTVSDTGIGIAGEHIPRIFERFYRVDKSHSKEVGGTGLGLSIVKHAAIILSAKIDVKSRIGEGTAISVLFPAYDKSKSNDSGEIIKGAVNVQNSGN